MEKTMEKMVDARGLPCPEPVVLTRRAIREGGAQSIRVVVDSDIAAGNVERMAKSEGWEAATERKGGDIHVVLTGGEGASEAAREATRGACKDPGASPKVVVFVPSSLFGTGEEELGRILMRAFVKTLKDIEPRPAQIIFANSGVRLTTEGSDLGSDLIDDLRALEKSGVEVISCGTCLDYYGLVDSLRVGRASNMFEIASALAGADRVVRP